MHLKNVYSVDAATNVDCTSNRTATPVFERNSYNKQHKGIITGDKGINRDNTKELLQETTQRNYFRRQHKGINTGDNTKKLLQETTQRNYYRRQHKGIITRDNTMELLQETKKKALNSTTKTSKKAAVHINRHSSRSNHKNSKLLQFIVQELCVSRGGCPGLSVLTSLLVSVDVKLY